MVGSAIVKRLHGSGKAPEGLEILTRTHDQLELTQQAAVHEFMLSEKPDVVVLAAAKVGGIHANSTYPGEFIYQNLMIQLKI